MKEEYGEVLCACKMILVGKQSAASPRRRRETERESERERRAKVDYW
jgi:hypothetical protein